MAYIDTNNIQFNSFDTKFFKTGKISNGEYDGATIDDLSDIASENGGKLPSIVNALEIDWNGAKPGFGEDDNGITTTGELFRQDFASVA